MIDDAESKTNPALKQKQQNIGKFLKHTTRCCGARQFF